MEASSFKNYTDLFTKHTTCIVEYPDLTSSLHQTRRCPRRSLWDYPYPPWHATQLEYEGGLTFVIGKNAKNVPAEDALDYVLGYTAGNDLSADR